MTNDKKYIGELNKLFDEFSQKVLEIDVLKNLSKESEELQLTKIEEQLKHYDKNNIDLENFTHFSTFHYTNIFRDRNESIGISEKSLLDLHDSIRFNLNRQYQWFLVEAYELYEKYVYDLYLLINSNDNSFFTTSELKKIPKIIIELRKKLIFMNNYELGNDNYLKGINLNACMQREKIDYQFYMALILELRNSIVHDRGIVKDKNFFLEKMFKKNNILEKEKKKEYLQNMEQFFGIGKYENLICVNELIVNSNKSFTCSKDRLNLLLGDIVSYSGLLKDLIIQTTVHDNLTN